jgi:hypothetical protein
MRSGACPFEVLCVILEQIIKIVYVAVEPLHFLISVSARLGNPCREYCPLLDLYYFAALVETRGPGRGGAVEHQEGRTTMSHLTYDNFIELLDGCLCLSCHVLESFYLRRSKICCRCYRLLLYSSHFCVTSNYCLDKISQNAVEIYGTA